MSNITKEEAQVLYESGNESFKEIALRCYPELEHREKKIGDYGVLEIGYWISSPGLIKMYSNETLTTSDINIYPTHELAELCGQIITQLTLWRDKYNGCKLKELKGQCLWLINENAVICYTYGGFITSTTPVFKTEKIAKQFLKDHKTLLTRYYELLYV